MDFLAALKQRCHPGEGRDPLHRQRWHMSGFRNALRLSGMTAVVVALLLPTPARAQDITSGLVHHWKLDETSGTTAADSAGSTNGTWTGSAAVNSAPGSIDEAFSFDGVDDVVTNNSFPFQSVPFTFSAWMKPQAASTTSKTSLIIASQERNFFIKWDSDFGVEEVLGFVAGGSSTTANIGTVVPGEWHLITGTYDGTTLKAYNNGVLVASTSTSATPDDQNDQLLIGDEFEGEIDDVRIYNRALTATDVLALYENWQPGNLRYNTNWRATEYFDGIGWNAMGRRQYVPNAVSFDINTDYLSRGSDLTGNADGKTASGSFWFRRTGGFGTTQYIYRTSGQPQFSVYIGNSNRISVAGYTAASSLIVTFGTPVSDSNWHHMMFSFDTDQTCTNGTSTGPGCFIYIDGVSQPLTVSAFTAGGIVDFTRTTHSLSAGSSGYNGELADFWIDTNRFVDLSQASNREKFYSNGPVYLGSDGSLPFGTAPELFFSGDTDTWENNDGTGGSFTENGALTDAPGDPGSIITPPTDGLVGYWKLDETSGLSVADYSGNSHTGTFSGNAAVNSAAGQIGTALVFDGTDDVISMANHSTLENFTALTLAAWVYPTASGQAFVSRIISKSNGGSGDDYHVGFTSANNVYFRITTGGVQTNFTGTLAVPNNQWSHVTAVWNGTDMRIYVNGVMDSTPVAKTGTLDATGDNLSIGAHIDTPASRRFQGRIDEARVYNRALDISEIQRLYLTTMPDGANCANPTRVQGTIIYNTTDDVMQFCNGEDWIAMGPPGDGGGGCSNPSGTAGRIIYQSARRIMQYCEGSEWIAVNHRDAPVDGLVGYWRLDETGGTNAADSSGNGLDGTLANGPVWQSSGGQVAGALDFDGTDDQVNLGTPAALTGLTANFTLSAWVNPATFSDKGGVIGKGIANADHFIIRSETNVSNCPSTTTGFVFRVTDSPADGDTNVEDCYQTAATGQWYHLAMVVGARGPEGLKAYVNGELAFALDTTNVAALNSSDPWFIGFEDRNNNWFDGLIDEVRVYNRALSAQEIADLYLATGGAF